MFRYLLLEINKHMADYMWFLLVANFVRLPFSTEQVSFAGFIRAFLVKTSVAGNKVDESRGVGLTTRTMC